MNPFEEEDNEITANIPLNIIIWVEMNGRKKNTYISGWNDIEHLKIIKKNKGCNGTIKDIDEDGNIVKVMQFQGDHSDYIEKYLINIGIDKEYIYIKG